MTTQTNNKTLKTNNKLYDFCKEWVSKRFTPFTIDDLKLDYRNKSEVNYKSWGGVFARMEQQGLIKFNDKFVKSKSKTRKGAYIKEWISIQYSEMQSKKRLSEETAKARELAKNQTNLNL